MLNNDILSGIKLKRESVTEFKGITVGMSNEPGILMNARNVFCDGIGVKSFPKWHVVRSMVSCEGIGSDGNLFWVENRRLYYNGYQVDGIYLSEGEKKLICFGGYLLVFPDMIYLSLSDMSRFGELNVTLNSVGSSQVKNCLSDLTPIENFSVLDEPPENPSVGDLRAAKDKNSDGRIMLRYDGNDWVELETMVRIHVSGASDTFTTDDVVEVTGIDNNCTKYLKICHISGNYVYFSGCVTDTSSRSVTLNRYFPEPDYVCVSEGRLCCIKSGYTSGGRTVSRLYASGEGNPFDFCTSGDGNAVIYDLPSAEKVRGIAEYNGNLAVFCNDRIKEITISKSKISCYDTLCDGLAEGAENSIAYLSDCLYFKGENGILCYNGSSVRNASQAIGEIRNTTFGNIGIAYKGQYYQYCVLDGQEVIVRYDPLERRWAVLDHLEISHFVVKDGALYAVTKNTDGATFLEIFDPCSLTEAQLSYCGDGVEREDAEISWSFESGCLCFEDMKGIYPEFLTVRISKKEGIANISLLADFETSDPNTYEIPNGGGVYTFPLKKKKCDTVRIRFSGNGDFELLGFMLGYTEESEVR